MHTKHKHKLVVAHDAACMAAVEHPAKRLGEIISWVDDSRNKPHDNVASILPVLKSKELDVNVTRAFSRLPSVHNVDSRLVVFVDRSGAILRESQFLQD